MADAVRPVVEWIDHPPAASLTAIDRGKPVGMSLKTLKPDDATRLGAYTEERLRRLRTPGGAQAG
ncbi:hypothetical protein Ssi02_50610 [Sinosporangium siamense]|uniref:Uncharacterized protein n=1 Tax=Sinosporangium siamense TaxID=1367973 RepID=A0A919V777_9ACTN|nr:hypothetical protein Ssi02_50610 [Sinosporangium siamense]